MIPGQSKHHKARHLRRETRDEIVARRKRQREARKEQRNK
jgi:hypothetical protein